MKTISTAIKNILAGRQFFLVDVFTFTLQDGTVLYYSSGSADLSYGGNTYSSGISTGGPFFKREGQGSTIKWTIGLDVDELNFTCIPGSGTITLASGSGSPIPFMQAVNEGVFDYAQCLVQRAVMTTWNDPSAGLIYLFDGLVGDVKSGKESALQFQIDSWKNLLSMNMPRNIYQPGCMNTLFDPACAVIKANYESTGTVDTGCTKSSLNTSSLTQATGYFNLGSLEFTSGDNTGVTVGIQQHTLGSPSTLDIIPPLPYTPNAGDAFKIYPGCDKRAVTCSNKFANLVNFRGFPFVPVPETAV